MPLKSYFNVPIQITINGRLKITVMVPIATIRRTPSLVATEITVDLFKKIRKKYSSNNVKLDMLPHKERLSKVRYLEERERFLEEEI